MAVKGQRTRPCARQDFEKVSSAPVSLRHIPPSGENCERASSALACSSAHTPHQCSRRHLWVLPGGGEWDGNPCVVVLASRRVYRRRVSLRDRGDGAEGADHGSDCACECSLFLCAYPGCTAGRATCANKEMGAEGPDHGHLGEEQRSRTRRRWRRRAGRAAPW